MRRADRLFQIIQVLRRSARPVTAAALAAELEVSKRTIYRDIADLAGQRVPILGEAGLGYVLGPGYDMPPLMLTPDEIEAAALGAQWVAARADPALARAARDLLAKIAAALPDHLRPHLDTPAVGVRPDPGPAEGAVDPAVLRNAARLGRKLRLLYRDAGGAETERVVWPVVLGYDDTARMLIAWCETRAAFRHFRADRMVAAEMLDERIGQRRAALYRRWQMWRAEHAITRTAP